MIWLLLSLSAAPAADDGVFYVDGGRQEVRLDDGVLSGGLPVQRTGEVVVRTAGDPAFLDDLPGVFATRRLRGQHPIVELTTLPGVDELALSATLQARPDVVWAHPDLAFTLHPHSVPDDPGLVDQWHLDNTGQRNGVPGVDLHVLEAWETATGAGQRIAILDSGVDLTHPDLVVIPGLDVIDDDDDPSPDSLSDPSSGHGTASAGCAAAVGDNGVGVAGVAHGAEIYATRLVGGATDLTDTYEAFVDAVDAGSSVLSNSWGYTEACQPFPMFDLLTEAIDYAETQGRGGLGAAVVVSAGNGDCDFSDDGFQAHPAVISVGAVSRFDVRESYSSYGRLLDVSAPSGAILTTDLVGPEGYGQWQGDDAYYPDYSGTSASAPLVSGVLALMFEANPRLTAAQARQVLCDTATRLDLVGGDWDDGGWSPWYGCGRVDAAAAVHAVVDAGAPSVPRLHEVALVAAPGAAVLTWEPSVDPDGEPVTYEVEIGVPGRRRLEDTLVTSVPRIDLSEALADAYPRQITVYPVDRWGRGEPAPTIQARVMPSWAEAGGASASCTSVPSPAGPLGAWSLLLLAGLGRRRGRGP